MALSLPRTEEKDHFERPSFRINNKIFATIRPDENRAVVMLPVIEQSVFCNFNIEVFYPVPGTWGKRGATFVNLQLADPEMILDALTIAYCKVAPKKLAEQFRKQ